MSRTLFISDLHLCPSRPTVNAAFFRLLAGEAVQADALYVLGDLFEYWIGDDDMTGLNQDVASGLRQLSDAGTRVFLMHGNRDFLIGERFCRTAGATLLVDPTVVELYGRPTLLMHGDTLCTDDVAYQDFRSRVRSPTWQSAFLSRPLAVRREEVEAMRQQSELAKQTKPMAIMDVSSDAVAETLRIFAYPPLFIHGHTHRPARHEVAVDGHPTIRRVLADWHDDRAMILSLDSDGDTECPLGG